MFKNSSPIRRKVWSWIPRLSRCVQFIQLSTRITTMLTFPLGPWILRLSIAALPTITRETLNRSALRTNLIYTLLAPPFNGWADRLRIRTGRSMIPAFFKKAQMAWCEFAGIVWHAMTGMVALLAFEHHRELRWNLT